MIRDTERARSALWGIDPECDREKWVKVAMAAKAAGLAGDDFDQWSSGAESYKPADAASVWKSTDAAGGITAGSLFFLAKEAGWIDSTQRARPQQSHQSERKPTEPPKLPSYDPCKLWDTCTPAAASHDYIARKQGLPDGLRVYSGSLTIAGVPCAGSLVLPCYSLAGELASLQFVPPEGKKLFLPGVKLSPDACLIVGGPVKADGVCYIVEGIGQAWSAHQATRAPAVVCFGWGRVAGVAKALRERFKTARLVIVPDVGKENQAAAIARDIAGTWVELPHDLG